jgi:outer membrane protein assembly factor BamB
MSHPSPHAGLGSLAKTVYALNAQTGNVDMRFPTHGGTWSTPVVSGGLVYIGGGDSRVYSLNAATGQQKWAYGLGNWISASPALADGMLYVGDTNGSGSKLYAIDAASARHVWTLPIGGSLYSSPAVAHGVVYVGSVTATCMRSVPPAIRCCGASPPTFRSARAHWWWGRRST